MPFTPFHFGPGAAIKAAIPKYFSFTVFCFAQVATDCETAYYMVQGVYPWHRFCHTYRGATVVGLFSLVVGRPLCQLALRRWAAWPAAPFRRYFAPVGSVIPFRSAAIGAFLGTYSHVFLDSIMHIDSRPFLPFSAANPFYGSVGMFFTPCLLHHSRPVRSSLYRTFSTQDLTLLFFLKPSRTSRLASLFRCL